MDNNQPLDPKPWRFKNQCTWRVPTGHEWANDDRCVFEPREGYVQSRHLYM